MISNYLIWVRSVVFGCVFISTFATICALWIVHWTEPWLCLTYMAMLTILIFPLHKAVVRHTSLLIPRLTDLAQAQANFLDSIQPKYIFLAVFASAALSLLLELSLIRWQSSMMEFFAYYKNFGLIACFTGLGLGYSLSNSKQIPLLFTLPLTGLQILVVTLMQVTKLTSVINKVPVTEQVAINMVWQSASGFPYWFAIYSVLVLIFCLTAIALIPVGQLCGRLMSRLSPLPAYGGNLLGSLAGVAAMTVLSYFWTPPVMWLGLCCFLTLVFMGNNLKALMISSLASIFALAVLAAPTKFGYEVIYSPYQIIERGVGPHGWIQLKAAGFYYQRVYDLSKASADSASDLSFSRDYYDLPYRIHPGAKNVLIIGSGCGNDLAAALRANVEHVDAVEIDPAIAELGKIYHPEAPYSDPRVRLILDDGRAFLRATKSKYDLVVFALIDSHTLSSSSSSLRLDSYIYTLQSFKEARNILVSPNGTVCLSFVSTAPEIRQKICKMLTAAFNQPPTLFFSGYDSSMSYLERKEGAIVLSPETLASLGRLHPEPAPAISNDIEMSTDDWPFFYMPRRVFPVSYIPLLAVVLIFALAMVYTLDKPKVQLTDAPFFLLGAGFMLVETKAITELGLQFGNTWLVTAIVVAAVISMAFISNLIVQKTNIKNVVLPFVLLTASLIVGVLITKSGGLESSIMGKYGTTVILTCPIIFSGFLFSILISKVKNIGSAMSFNILGALCGGLLEYNAMYFGYGVLYYFAIAIYLAAFICIVMTRKSA